MLFSFTSFGCIGLEGRWNNPESYEGLAIIVAAVDAWGKTNCDDKFSRLLSKVLSGRGVEYFEEGLDGVTSWVADVIWRALGWRISTH